MSPVRTFDGDDKITTAIGSLNFAFGPGTVALILRKADDTVSKTPFVAGVSSISARYGLAFGTTQLRARCGNTLVSAPTITVEAVDGWVLVAWTKATGTVAPRFHAYDFGTATWTHEDAGSTVANSGVPATSAFFGAANTVEFFTGDLGIGAVWNTVLADAAIEALIVEEAAWSAASPLELWVFDQASPATALQSTGTADQTAITGTSVTETEIPWTGGGGEIEEGSGDLDATGSLSGSAKIAVTAGGSLSGASSLSGTASNTATSGGSLLATSELSGSGELTCTGTGALSSTSSLSGTASVLAVVTGEGSLSSTSTLMGSSSLTLGGYGALSGTSTLEGTVNMEWAGGGELSAESELIGTGSLGAIFGSLKTGRISDVREGRISNVHTGRII